MSTLLVIEDDHPLRTALERGLGDRGHVVLAGSAASDPAHRIEQTDQQK